MYEFDLLKNGLIIDKIGTKLFNANFATAVNPWFKRGGNWNNGANAGVMTFNRDNGNANSNYGHAYSSGSFRVVVPAS